MPTKVHFFNHWGEYENNFTDFGSTSRSWVLNGYGRCDITIPLDHPACNENMLRFGNFIHVEHIPTIDPGGPTDPTLPETDPIGKLMDWTGIILPVRKWNKNSVSVSAYSLEGVLVYRAMPYATVRGTPDFVFKEIIRLSNQGLEYPTFEWKYADPVETSTLTYSDDLRTNAYEHIRKLTTFANMEWRAFGVINVNYALDFLLTCKNRRYEPSGLALTSINTEQQDPLMEEQGVPFNMIFAYSQASTEAERTKQLIIYQSSLDDYGPIQINQTFIGVHDTAGTAEAARAQSEINGRPRRVFKRIALNKGLTFDYLRPGAIVSVEETTVGFNVSGGFGFKDLARILSMDYNSTTDKVNLNVEIIPQAFLRTSNPRDLTRT